MSDTWSISWYDTFALCVWLSQFVWGHTGTIKWSRVWQLRCLGIVCETIILMPIVVMGSRLLFNDGDTINKPSGARPFNGYCASVIKVMLCVTIKRIFNNEKCICELQKKCSKKKNSKQCMCILYLQSFIEISASNRSESAVSTIILPIVWVALSLPPFFSTFHFSHSKRVVTTHTRILTSHFPRAREENVQTVASHCIINSIAFQSSLRAFVAWLKGYHREEKEEDTARGARCGCTAPLTVRSQG